MYSLQSCVEFSSGFKGNGGVKRPEGNKGLHGVTINLATFMSVMPFSVQSANYCISNPFLVSTPCSIACLQIPAGMFLYIYFCM